MHKTLMSLAVPAAITLTLLASPLAVQAAPGHGNSKKTAEIGKPGENANVSRTIKINMYDNYYEPENLNLKEGETVRFLITNKGDFVHEFNIATAAMHKAHGPEMEMMVEHGVLEPDKINWDAAKKMQESMGHGMHKEGNSVLLEPGQTGKIVWTFPKHAKLEFACNIPGHYDSGMMGKIKLSH